MELNFILDILLCLSVICLKMYRHIWFQTYFIKSCWTFPKQLLTDLINWFCFHLLKTNTLLEEHKRSGEIIAKQSTYLSKQTFFCRAFTVVNIFSQLLIQQYNICTLDLNSGIQA